MSAVRLLWALVGALGVISGLLSWLLARWHNHELPAALAWELLAVQLGAAAVLLLGLHAVVRALRAPLEEMVGQMRALGEGRYEFVSQPRLAELAGLSKALNVTVARVKDQMQQRDQAVGNLSDKLAHDGLTHVASRDVFFALLKRLLQEQPARAGVAIVRVVDLEGLNRRFGRSRTDDFLVSVATTLRARLLLDFPQAELTVARLNGADFGLLVAGVDLDTWRQSAARVAQAMADLRQQALHEGPQVAWTGGTVLRSGESPSDAMSRADAAVAVAMGRQDALWLLDTEGVQERRLLDEWRVVFDNALGTGHLRLRLADTAEGPRRAELCLVEPDGTWLEPAAFRGAALRCDRQADMDLRAVDLALSELATVTGELALEVLVQSLRRPVFLRQLGELLRARPEAAARLVLEVADPTGAAELAYLVERLRSVCEPLGTRVGLVLGLRGGAWDLLVAMLARRAAGAASSGPATSHLRVVTPQPAADTATADAALQEAGLRQAASRDLARLFTELGQRLGLPVWWSVEGVEASATRRSAEARAPRALP